MINTLPTSKDSYFSGLLGSTSASLITGGLRELLRGGTGGLVFLGLVLVEASPCGTSAT